MADCDAIVVGAGHNGLVAALVLARAGWKTLVLERNPRVGGAIMSGEITRPGFVHDLYSTNQNLFVASPVYKELQGELERHGLRYRVASKPYCNVFPDGKSLRAYTDVERTLEGFRRHDPRDAEGWRELREQFQAFSRALLPLYNLPLPSLDAGLALGKAVRALGLDGLTRLGQTVVSSTRELGRVTFASAEARALLAVWGLHLDFGPDVAGGSFFPLLSTFDGVENGIAVAEGGASHTVEALAGLLAEYGGEVRTQTPVEAIFSEGGRVCGVRLASGERIAARRAVIANLAPTVLVDLLERGGTLPNSLQRGARQYLYGPATMVVHLALSGPPRWAAGEELSEFAYVHVAPYVEDLARTYHQSMGGYLPDSPLLVVGQTSAVDPTRAPDGQQVLWVQVRTLPAAIQGDAAGEIAARDWAAAGEPFADRVMQKLERYAPGIGQLVLERVVFSPRDLENHNPNLVGGDSLSGSHHPRQNFLWRPFPGWSTYRMPLDGLYMIGAATWPGAGTNATSGYLAAQQLLHPHATRNRLLAGGALAGASAAAGLLLARRLRGR